MNTLITRKYFVIYFPRDFGYHIMQEQKFLGGIIQTFTSYPNKYKSTFFKSYNEAQAFLK